MATFENDIEQQLSSFELEPSVHVWQGVEASLLEKKKRRIVAWWWVPVLGFLLLGFSFWMVNSNGKNAKNDIAITTTSADKNYNTATPEKESNNELVKKEMSEQIFTNQEHSTKQEVASNYYKRKEKSTFLMPIKASKNGLKRINKHTIANKRELNNQFKNASSSNSTSVKTTSRQNNELVNVQSKNAPIDDSNVNKHNLKVAVQDSLNLAATTKPILALKKDSGFVLLDSFNKKLKPVKAKKQNWFLVAGGGMSYVRDNNLFGGGNNASNAAFQSAMLGSGVTSGGSSTSYIIPKAGFSFLLGLTYEHYLSKRLYLQTGLQYRYVQNKAFVFYSNNQNNLMDLANPATNYSHWVQVPVSLKYNLVSKPAFNIQAIIGGSLAIPLSQKWIAMPGNDSFVYNRSYNSRLIASGHVGLAITKKNGYGVSLLAEQSLTPIQNSNTPKYYWRQWYLQLNIPARKIFSKK